MVRAIKTEQFTSPSWLKLANYLIVDYRFFMKISASQIQFIWQNNVGFSHM